MAERKFKPFTLALGEYVMAVVPQYASGPGWVNRPIWVHIGNNGTNTFRTECIQPEEQTAEMLTLFAPGAAMCSALLACVPVKKQGASHAG